MKYINVLIFIEEKKKFFLFFLAVPHDLIKDIELNSRIQ